MSKRSSRRKRKERQQKQQNPTVLTHQGLTAFRQGDYAGAIKAWEQARGKPTTSNKLPMALAEAYFRHAVSTPLLL